ncbi:MAG: hypothetical protein J6M56_14300 [Clostridia bacterium]|nr:hypothetical protein [Clostridia bacterium]
MDRLTEIVKALPEMMAGRELLSAMTTLPDYDDSIYVRREARLNTRGFGACHQFWKIKKSILKEAYGIEWYTPQEEYPHMHFD